MVACYFGHDVDLNSLRQKFAFSTSGANVRNLMEISRHLSLSMRTLRIEMEMLPELHLPAILHWSGNHFVVLTKITRNRAVIHDPAIGLVEMSLAEMSKRFTGIALEFSRAEDFKPIHSKVSIKISHLWNNIHGLPVAILQIILLSIAFQLVAFALPLQIQLVIDNAIVNSDQELLPLIAVGFLALFILHALIEAIRGWLLQLTGQQLILQVIGNLTRHLLKLPTSFFEKRHLGDILSRMQSIRTVQDIVLRGVIAALIDGVMAIIAISLLFLYSVELASIVLVGFSVIAIVNYIFLSAIRKRTEEQLAAAAKEQSFFMETIRAVTAIKLLGRETERESSWRNLFIRSTNLGMRISKLHILLTFIQNSITGAQYVAIVFVGAKAIISANGFSVGMLMAFLSFRQTFSDRATAFISQVNQMRVARLHLDRIADIVAEPAEVTSDHYPLLDVSGEIQLKDIVFSYGSSDPVVLYQLDLHIKQGEFVAITGGSGSGKSTLLKILLGLYVPMGGHIELDGMRATPEYWRAWRRFVSVVSQDDKLISGSIAENIAFFDPDMNMDKIVDAAKKARIHNDILMKPMRYQTLIGDMGAALSGGQKQRLLLARAIYREPKIIILDEGTANLDTFNETQIGEYLSALNITRIVVSHRPDLINRAHRVLQLTDGRLVEILKEQSSETQIA